MHQHRKPQPNLLSRLPVNMCSSMDMCPHSRATDTCYFAMDRRVPSGTLTCGVTSLRATTYSGSEVELRMK